MTQGSDLISAPHSLKDAYVMSSATGDVASGSVRLVYLNEETDETVNIELQYDTIGTPDGLKTTLVVSEGDLMSIESEGPASGSQVEVSSEMREYAMRTLSKYSHEAVRTSGVHGVNDGWLPENC